MLICPKCHSTNYDGKYCSNCGYGKFIRQPQTVEITWYPYPENIPTPMKDVFICNKTTWCEHFDSDNKPIWESATKIYRATYGNGGFYVSGGCVLSESVIAFAELPKGYKEERER